MICGNKNSSQSYQCTLNKGHKGPHIAYDDPRHRKQDIVGVWN